MKKKIAIFSACVATGIILPFITNYYDLPFFMEMIGIMIAVVYMGFFPSMGVAAVQLTLVCLSGNQSLEVVFYKFIIYEIIAAIFRGIIKKDVLKHIDTVLMTGFILGIAASVLFVPYNFLLFAGATGNKWGDALYHMLRFNGLPKYLSAISASVFLNLIDKQITVFLVYFIAKIIGFFCKKFHKGKIKR